MSVINKPPEGKYINHAFIIIGPEDRIRPGDGIAIFLDGARYLPANVGPTKVIFRILSGSKRSSKTDYQTSIDIETFLYNPLYQVRDNSVMILLVCSFLQK